MTPRPYRLGRRETGVEETREKVVDAARQVFSEEGFYEVTLEDVAKRAGVARATVYYQFKSKLGLLEAAIDATVTRAPVEGLRRAMEDPDPLLGVAAYAREICSLWARDHVFYRNVFGLAAVDLEAQQAVHGYDVRRREPLVFLGKRLAEHRGVRTELSPRHCTDTVWTLTNFRSFDHLTSRGHLSPRKAADTISSMLDCALLSDRVS
jgi:AcrR family transcriptional regulator